ncbi:putative ABC transporter ATP-binding protein YbbL [Rubripirellula lacrimiformis]|uniref:Putative ABC transporter ATP-binding protein YbbL n=1 Tax=Rubripirellula lacrimiformis TaxID=1930273 RepID=A0A517NI64_9BACT|nr:ATP-binding cassette domain-containing protein [Rubripirellula lacrimiformis]QDT06825.1 putative ABC transporter ATP-binding protein YbbL [Rubripirellula lacrimiformis]
MNDPDVLAPPVIEGVGIVRRDSKTNRTLLSGVSLHVDAGESLGLEGASGSGKSTLLRALALLDPIEGGEVRYLGKVIQKSAVPGFRRNVVYLAQRPSMVVGTVLQNLSLPFTFASAERGLDHAAAVELLGVLDRDESMLDQDAMTLSGGEQQLIALVRAILVDPDVILLDEPTASLDPASTDRFEQLATTWKRADARRSWVWTSHDADQVDRLTSRRVRLADGSVVDG